MLAAEVYLKPENLQKTGSFKIRGAYNRIAALSPAEAARGMIAASAGNHGQALAWAASRAGMQRDDRDAGDGRDRQGRRDAQLRPDRRACGRRLPRSPSRGRGTPRAHRRAVRRRLRRSVRDRRPGHCGPGDRRRTRARLRAGAGGRRGAHRRYSARACRARPARETYRRRSGRVGATQLQPCTRRALNRADRRRHYRRRPRHRTRRAPAVRDLCATASTAW